jgi:putative addiction module killer protein
MECTFKKTQIFQSWLEALRDKRGKNRIEARIENAEDGNLGDCWPVGDGVSEMRLHLGPGYRLYFFQHGKQLYWLLIGGDKDTQSSDVKLAKAIKLKIQRGEKC